MDTLQTIFFAALAVMLGVSALLAFRARSTLPLLYAGALLAVGAIVWLSGSTTTIEAPDTSAATPGVFDTAGSPEGRARLTGLAGACAAVCAIFFWDRLLLLRIHAPRARFAVFGAGMVVAIAGTLMLIPGLSAARLEAVQQLASLGLLPTMAWTAVLAWRAGFRPALYSTMGVLFFLAMAAAHVAHSRNWFVISTTPLKDQLLLLGFLGEFVWFVLSLAGRAAVLGNPHDPASERAGIRDYQARHSRRKYERSTLGPVDLDGLQARLDRLMHEDRLYCDEDLSLNRLAVLCEVSRHELSEFLNQRLGVNFNRYVNDFRVREAQQRLLEEPERTALDIAFASGFNSKTRFNIEFKRVTGQTPREYRQSAGQ